jgi:osmoprotectant transport system permease protein
MEVFSEFWDYITTADHWSGRNGIIELTWAHIRISVIATTLAALVTLPLAVYLGHIRKGGFLAISIVNIGRAIPSLAIIALLVTVQAIGFGFRPTLLALIALAIPPMFTNAYTGVRDVDRNVVEAARGMGMTSREVLLRVEVPSALPLLIAGLRIAALQVVATATLGAIVAFQCLGSLITQGIAQFDDGKLVTGAVLVALLALLTDAFFVVLLRALTPWLRRGAKKTRPLEMADPMTTAVPVV